MTFHLNISQSTVTFAKNTLDYPVLGQGFYNPLYSDSVLWCEKEPVEPIELLPDEMKIVMDYSKLTGIKVFRSSDSLLLYEAMDMRSWGVTHDELYYYPYETLNFGVPVEDIVSKLWKQWIKGYFLQDEKYLFENVPWNIYPIGLEDHIIGLEDTNCTDRLLKEYDEWRKNLYKEQTNGYADIKYIVFNKDAECFANRHY
ncbi:MAG: hypothetical protein LBT04_08440 [Prevotellaceae bacterium]|jgi:hypothetical protein|nr:hypothetical protein [Prevotellaceae bacterium]